jgi:ABC-type multidrug transport system fused ATPase/permease subunit
MEAALPQSTADVFRLYRPQLMLTYTLSFFENLFELLYPLMIGIAIDGLLDGALSSLLPLLLTWTMHAALAALRQLYDARLFARIFREMVAGMVIAQGQKGTSTSHLAARSGLVSELVDYYEYAIPFIIAVLTSFIGALIFLALFDGLLGIVAVCVLLVSLALNINHRRTTRRLNRALNDQIESEIVAIESRDREIIRSHYSGVAEWYVRLAHADVRAWVGLQPFLVGIILLALFRGVTNGLEAGDIFTIVLYAMRFTDSLEQLPQIVEQFGRLQDIDDRIRVDDEGP